MAKRFASQYVFDSPKKLEDYDASLGQTFVNNMMSQRLKGPEFAIHRFRNRFQANTGVDLYQAFLPGTKYQEQLRDGPDSHDWLTPEEVHTRYAEKLNLSLEEFRATGLKTRDYGPMTSERVVELDIAAWDAERRYQRFIRRTPDTWKGTGVGMLGAMAAELTSPIAVNVALLPVGQASLLANTIRHGPTMARIIQGTVQGFVGATLIEPFQALSEHQIGLNEYTSKDALVNIGLGTAFGMTLHVAGGTLSDALSHLPGSERKSLRELALIDSRKVETQLGINEFGRVDPSIIQTRSGTQIDTHEASQNKLRYILDNNEGILPKGEILPEDIPGVVAYLRKALSFWMDGKTPDAQHQLNLIAVQELLDRGHISEAGAKRAIQDIMNKKAKKDITLSENEHIFEGYTAKKKADKEAEDAELQAAKDNEQAEADDEYARETQEAKSRAEAKAARESAQEAVDSDPDVNNATQSEQKVLVESDDLLKVIDTEIDEPDADAKPEEKGEAKEPKPEGEAKVEEPDADAKPEGEGEAKEPKPEGGAKVEEPKTRKNTLKGAIAETVQCDSAQRGVSAGKDADRENLKASRSEEQTARAEQAQATKPVPVDEYMPDDTSFDAVEHHFPLEDTDVLDIDEAYGPELGSVQPTKRPMSDPEEVDFTAISNLSDIGDPSQGDPQLEEFALHEPFSERGFQTPFEAIEEAEERAQHIAPFHLEGSSEIPEVNDSTALKSTLVVSKANRALSSFKKTIFRLYQRDRMEAQIVRIEREDTNTYVRTGMGISPRVLEQNGDNHGIPSYYEENKAWEESVGYSPIGPGDINDVPVGKSDSQVLEAQERLDEAEALFTQDKVSLEIHKEMEKTGMALGKAHLSQEGVAVEGVEGGYDVARVRLKEAQAFYTGYVKPIYDKFLKATQLHDVARGDRAAVAAHQRRAEKAFETLVKEYDDVSDILRTLHLQELARDLDPQSPIIAELEARGIHRAANTEELEGLIISANGKFDPQYRGEDDVVYRKRLNNIVKGLLDDNMDAGLFFSMNHIPEDVAVDINHRLFAASDILPEYDRVEAELRRDLQTVVDESFAQEALMRADGWEPFEPTAPLKPTDVSSPSKASILPENKIPTAKEKYDGTRSLRLLARQLNKKSGSAVTKRDMNDAMVSLGGEELPMSRKKDEFVATFDEMFEVRLRSEAVKRAKLGNEDLVGKVEQEARISLSENQTLLDISDSLNEALDSSALFGDDRRFQFGDDRRLQDDVEIEDAERSAEHRAETSSSALRDAGIELSDAADEWLRNQAKEGQDITVIDEDQRDLDILLDEGDIRIHKVSKKTGGLAQSESPAPTHEGPLGRPAPRVGDELKPSDESVVPHEKKDQFGGLRWQGRVEEASRKNLTTSEKREYKKAQIEAKTASLEAVQKKNKTTAAEIEGQVAKGKNDKKKSVKAIFGDGGKKAVGVELAVLKKQNKGKYTAVESKALFKPPTAKEIKRIISDRSVKATKPKPISAQNNPTDFAEAILDHRLRTKAAREKQSAVKKKREDGK